jgi:phosphatidate cytidylyltransferase
MAVGVVAAIVFLPPIGLLLLLSLVMLIGAWEWADLAGFSSYLAKTVYLIVVAALLAALVHYGNLLGTNVDWLSLRDVLGVGCLWWAMALLWVKSYPSSALLWGSRWMRALIGLLTLIPAWLALIYLRGQDDGQMLILLLIAFVSSADIGAYFSGKRWGKAKLAPEVSPGKSWAGFWGGLVVSNLFAVSVWYACGEPLLSMWQLLSIAPIVAMVSVLGDLLESMIKRHRGVKDSGTILPGHGGILDRIDSLTAAAPVFALSLMLVVTHV